MQTNIRKICSVLVDKRLFVYYTVIKQMFGINVRYHDSEGMPYGMPE